MLRCPTGFLKKDTGGGAPWTPADYTTEVWLKSDDATTVNLTGNNVTSWDDKSGNGYSFFAPSGERQPLYNTATQDGKDVIRFLQDTLQESPAVTGIKAAFFVIGDVKLGNNNTNWVSHVLGGAGTSNTDYTFIVTNVAQAYNISIDGNRSNSGNAGVNGNTPVSGGNIDLGLSVTETEDWNVWYADYDLAAGVQYLAALADANQYSVEINIAEIVLLTSIPTLGDRQRFEGYLAHEWGLEGNLPAGHPYKSSPPTT